MLGEYGTHISTFSIFLDRSQRQKSTYRNLSRKIEVEFENKIDPKVEKELSKTFLSVTNEFYAENYFLYSDYMKFWHFKRT